MKSKAPIYAILSIVLFSLYFVYATITFVGLEKEIDRLNVKLFDLQMENRQLNEEIEMIRSGNWLPMQVEATGYAPLDPAAIEGACYSGDPNITASKSQSDPSRTVAMGKSIPFGTQVYIPGIGHRVVEDRGGAITDNHIDIMFRTQAEALAFGRQEILIFIRRK